MGRPERVRAASVSAGGRGLAGCIRGRGAKLERGGSAPEQGCEDEARPAARVRAHLSRPR
eukprot:1039355-Pyramimonas_sp.AAC.1